MVQKKKESLIRNDEFKSKIYKANLQQVFLLRIQRINFLLRALFRLLLVCKNAQENYLWKGKVDIQSIDLL